MAEVACLHKIQLPLAKIETSGWGNCFECEPDEANNKCAGYWPIEIKAKEKKSDKIF